VERDFAGDGNAGLGGAHIVGVARQAERGAEQPETAVGLGVERALGLGVIGDRLLEVERLGFPGHGGNSESGRRASPANRSLPSAGLAHVPARLSL
jgi:hypothetical protein